MLFAKGEIEKLNIGFCFMDELLLVSEHFDSSTFIVSGNDLISSKIVQSVFEENYNPKTEDESKIIQVYKTLRPNEFFKTELQNSRINFLIGTKGSSCYMGLREKIELNNINIKDFINFSFIYASKNKDEVLFTLYHIFVKDDDVFVKKVEEHSLKFVIGEGLILKDLDIESFYEFIKRDEKNFLLNQIEFFYDLMFDFYSYKKGFFDIYKELKFIKNKVTFHDSLELVGCYYWLIQHKYYLFIEQIIKSKYQMEKIIETNPFYTKKEIPDLSEIKMISSKNRRLLEQLTHSSEDYIDITYQLESNSKIGNNGVTILFETLLKLEKMKRKLSWDFNLSRYFFNEKLLEEFETIINTFDIKPKELIDKAIREMFYNNISFSEVIDYVYDYIQMCKMFSIEIEKKVPKDIIKKHDILLKRKIEIRDEMTKKAFQVVANENKALIKDYEDSDYLIKIPETVSELIQEGFELNHCVGSYTNAVVKKASKIFFIRKKSNPNISFVTVELDKNNQLVQIKGFSNTTPQKEVIKFVNDWIQDLGGKDNE